MRERVEDLGRIATLIDVMLDLGVWDVYSGRSKDFLDHFERLNSEKRGDLLSSLIYGLNDLKDKLHEISAIAEGKDDLNEST